MNALAEHHAVIYGSDLEATVSLCLRCMDCSNYTVRLEAARLLGHVLARTQNSVRAAGSSTVLSTLANAGSSTSAPSESAEPNALLVMLLRKYVLTCWFHSWNSQHIWSLLFPNLFSWHIILIIRGE